MHSSFYVVVFVNLHMALTERIAVGFVMGNQRYVYFKIADAKLKALSHFIKPQEMQLVKLALRSLAH
jgi:hypothetical protein